MESTDLPTVDAIGKAPKEPFVKTSDKGVPGDCPDVPQVLRDNHHEQTKCAESRFIAKSSCGLKVHHSHSIEFLKLIVQMKKTFSKHKLKQMKFCQYFIESKETRNVSELCPKNKEDMDTRIMVRIRASQPGS